MQSLRSDRDALAAVFVAVDILTNIVLVVRTFVAPHTGG